MPPFRAMILAAGHGTRMRPLTDALPKPLLRAGGRALIEHQLMHLAQAGFVEIVINHAYLGHMIEAALGDGTRYGVRIRYSPEAAVLETAGGISQALPLLQDENASPFLVVNADVYCEFDLVSLLPVLRRMRADPGADVAHLVLVDNPLHHLEGDFTLESGRVFPGGRDALTFGGIGAYRPELFRDVVPGTAAKLAPLLRAAATSGRVSGRHYRGMWVDVGTPERLRDLDDRLGGPP